MQCFEWQSLSSSTFRLLRGGSASGIVTKWSQGRRLVGVQLYSDCFFLPSCLCHCETILSFSFFLKIHHHVSISITIVSKLLEQVNISVLFMPNILSVSEVYKMYIFSVSEIRVRPSDKRYIHANESSNTNFAANQNNCRTVIILLEKR